jgi:tetratricopeptide (TPR) repeat protein
MPTNAFTCPTCKKLFRVLPSAAEGSAFACPHCGKVSRLGARKTTARHPEISEQTAAQSVSSCAGTVEIVETSPPTETPLPGTEPVVTKADPPPKQPSTYSPWHKEIAPAKVLLRSQGGTEPECRESVMAALTRDALWLQYAGRLRAIPLGQIRVETTARGSEMALAVESTDPTEKLALVFPTRENAEEWRREMAAQQEKLVDLQPHNVQASQGAVVLRRPPNVPYEEVAYVTFAGATSWAAERGLQLLAGLRGADAVIHVKRSRCTEMGWRARCIDGSAIRVQDADARDRLRLRWYAEQVMGVVWRAVLLLFVQAALLGLVAAMGSRAPLQAPNEDSRSEFMVELAIGNGLLYAWPLILLGLLAARRWPELLRPVGVAILAATTGRGIVVWVAHVLAVVVTGASADQSHVIAVFFDPFTWALMIAGVWVCRRAWNLAHDAREVLPANHQAVPRARKGWARGLLAVTGIYALALAGFGGFSRYSMSAYLLQPGVDARQEEQALQALNQGVDQAERDDLASAEQSWRRADRLWQKLTTNPAAPVNYRVNHATVLYNLGWVHEKKGLTKEAEEYYARAVAMADTLPSDSSIGEESRKAMASVRQALARLRGGAALHLLEEKQQAAARKFEAAEVKDDQQKLEAEKLYGEAISLWEEILPRLTDPKDRAFTISQLATAYLRLGALQQRIEKLAAAEASLKKSTEFGKEAVTLEPDSPANQHSLDVARQRLEKVRDDAFDAEIATLCSAERFADVFDRMLKRIEEAERNIHSGAHRDEANRQLAYRCDRFAWFAAHCPDERVRDTRAAVRRAEQATKLQPDVADYWYTLAMVQYRNGEWSASLASLAQVKVKAGTLDASDWFLSAMDLCHLKRRQEARDAMHRGDTWLRDLQEQAKEKPVLRLRLELNRPAIDALRREAENLLEGKAP